MELSSKLLSDILGFCSLDLGEVPLPGRRKHARLPLGTRAALSSVKRGVDGVDHSVVVRDISASGIGLLVSEQMETGEEFVVQFTGEHGIPARILCIVRHCSSGGFGGSQFIIGATFELVIFPVQAQPVRAEGVNETKLACLMPDDGSKPPAVAEPYLVGTIASSLRSGLARTGRWCLNRLLDLNEDATRTA